MKRVPVVVFLAVSLMVLADAPALAETRRALLVGIDRYRVSEPTKASAGAATKAVTEVARGKSPGKSLGKSPGRSRGTWTDLDGCVNDVDAMKEILTKRYGFAEKDVLVLRNADATRERILGEIQRHLAVPAAAGDVSFFFYAGHGSQVPNLKTKELDGRDETLVPADSALGALDIRDKELARAFGKVLDRSVVLTVVLDSCHSGSAVRGLRVEKTRDLPMDPRTVGDPGDDIKPLDERGALILSAAQDDQLAGEGRDETNVPHGAFSLALLGALRNMPVNETGGRLFAQVKAIMQSEGRLQEPVAEGKARLEKPFFGVGSATLSGRVSVAVRRVDGPDSVELQGGSALGLAPGCELVLAENGSARGVRVRVTEVTGMSLARAKVTEGSEKNLLPGTLLEVDVWTAQGDDLKVWIAPDTIALKALQALGREIAGLKSSGKVRWVEDPSEELPTVVIGFEKGQWALTDLESRRSFPLGPKVLASGVLATLSTISRKEPPRVFLRLPPAAELVTELETRLGLSNPESAIRRAESEGAAHYLFVGRMGKDGPEYAFVLPNPEDTDARKLPLPLRSDWIAAGGDAESLRRVAAQLDDKALTLRRVRGWLTLGPGGGEGARAFPYSLALRNVQTGALLSLDTPSTKEIETGGRRVLHTSLGPVLAGEQYALALVRDKELPAKVQPRRVYVFAIDRNGKGVVLFPRAQVENRFPIQTGTDQYPERIDLNEGRAAFKVGEPYGVDTYVLLTSDDAIDPSTLEWEGARTRGARSGSNALERLILRTGAKTRGFVVDEVPKSWSIERLPVKSAAK